MPRPLPSPRSVTFVGYLLFLEAMRIFLGGLLSANTVLYGEKYWILAIGLVAWPLLAAGLGWLILRGSNWGRFGLFFSVLAGFGVAICYGTSLGNWVLLAIDAILCIPLVRPNANEFFAGRDYRRRGIVEDEPVPESEMPPSPRIIPRRPGPRS